MSRDRRKHPRATFPAVRVLLHGDGAPNDEFLQNLSAGGLFIRTERTLPVGSRLEVQIHRPQAEPLHVQAEVRRLQVSEHGLPGMGLQFLGVSEEMGEGLERLVEPFVQAFRRESAEEDLRSKEALDSRVHELEARLAAVDATARGLGLTEGGGGRVRASGSVDDAEEDADTLTIRISSLEAQLELAAERAHTERRLRAQAEAELTEARARLRQLEDVQVDKVELEERVSALELQLHRARELVSRSTTVASDALLRLGMIHDPAPDQGRPPSSSDSPLEEAPPARAVEPEGGSSPQGDVLPDSPPQILVHAAADSAVDESAEETAADDLVTTAMPRGGGTAGEDREPTGQLDELVADREATLVPLLAEDSTLEEHGVDPEGTGSGVPIDNETAEALSRLDPIPRGVPLSADEESMEFDLDLTSVGEGSEGGGEAIALGAGLRDAAPAAPPPGVAEAPADFVALSPQALAAAREGRGDQFSNPVKEEGLAALILEESDAAAPPDVEATEPRQPDFDWQEETVPDGLRIPRPEVSDPQEEQAQEEDELANEAVFQSETPTRSLRIEEVPSRLTERGHGGSHPRRSESQELLIEERTEVINEVQDQARESTEEVASRGILGPEQVPTREVFAGHLQRGADLAKTDRFHRLEPVSRADILVSDWLARTEEYAELASLAEGTMSESELQRVLHLFFERGLLVLRENS